MRILAGEFRGRVLVQPKTSATRPMTEKARAAIFDVIGDIWQADVIDAYAGSGAVGLEALSRGARSVWAIETNRLAIQAIKRNLKACGFEDEGGGVYLGPGAISYDLSVRSVAQVTKADPEESDCQLIVADPPYDTINPLELSLLARFLDKTAGVMVVSHTSKIPSPDIKSFELVGNKVYGDSALSFYRLK